MLVVINKDSLIRGGLCGKLHGGPSQLLLERPPVIDPIARYSSRIAICAYPSAFDALVSGFPSEYRHNVWYRNTRMVWLPDREKILEDMFIRFDRMHKRDRRTDRQTDRLSLHDVIGRAYA